LKPAEAERIIQYHQAPRPYAYRPFLSPDYVNGDPQQSHPETDQKSGVIYSHTNHSDPEVSNPKDLSLELRDERKSVDVHIPAQESSDDKPPTFDTIKRNMAEKTANEEDINKYRLALNSSNDPVQWFEFAKLLVQNGSVTEGYDILKKIASNGFSEANYYLGMAYNDDSNSKYAFKYFLSASKKGHPAACYQVALASECGAGCSVNLKLAFQMFTKAATAGHKRSLFRLGMAELKGELGARKDPIKAIKWFKRGAACKS
jgi:TPR repeat protein